MIPMRKSLIVRAWRTSVFLVLFALLTGCAGACGKNDSAMQGLRDMPSSTYARLFSEAESPECQTICELAILNEFRQFATRRLELRKYSRPERGAAGGYVMLKFCFDEGLLLRLRGLGTESGQVYVEWGGVPPSDGRELLWSRSAQSQEVN